MDVKKNIGMFLLVSFQMHGMFTIQPGHKKKASVIPQWIKNVGKAEKVKEYANEIEKGIALENYEHNKSNFFVLNQDITHHEITHLDHLSNIQFIKSSKHLYEKYTTRTSDGSVSHHNCLFTQLPFPFEFLTRARFYYDGRDKAKVDMLPKMENIEFCSRALLRQFNIDVHDTGAVMNFYHQDFSLIQDCSSIQIWNMLQNLELMQIMLKRGLSPSLKDASGNTIIFQALISNKHDMAKLLLSNNQVCQTVSSLEFPASFANLCIKNPEVAKLLFQKTSFSTKIKFPAIVLTGSLVASLIITKMMLINGYI